MYSHLLIIEDDITNIEKTISKFHKTVDRIVERAYQKIQKGVEVYNADYIRESLAPTTKIDAKSEYDTEQYIALATIRNSFDQIDMEIQQWVTEPIPQDFQNLITFIASNGIELNSAEVEILRDKSSGCYFSRRLTEALAMKSGMVLSNRYGNADIVEIRKQIREVRSACENAITDYFGHPEKGAFTGEFLSERDINVHFSYMAFDFPNRDTLTEFQKFITEQISPQDTLGLTPAKKAEIDELYKDCKNDGQKIELTAKLLESDSKLDGVLRLYDQKLYSNGLDYIIKSQRDKARQAIEQVEIAKADALNTAQNAARTSANAERRKLASVS